MQQRQSPVSPVAHSMTIGLTRHWLTKRRTEESLETFAAYLLGDIHNARTDTLVHEDRTKCMAIRKNLMLRSDVPFFIF
jgi:hypothetical protein